MNYIDVVNILTTCAMRNPLVNSVYYVREARGANDIRYGAFILLHSNTSLSGSTSTYTFTALYADRLTSRGNNELEIHAQGEYVLSDIVNALRNDDRLIMTDDTITIEHFTHQWADDCAGAACQLSVQVVGDGLCEWEGTRCNCDADDSNDNREAL